MAKIPSCPVCGRDDLRTLVDFGPQPLWSNLLNSPDEKIETHPGEYLFCADCRFAFIAEYPDRRKQYEEFEYFSSRTFPPHVQELADRIAKTGRSGGSFALEIGSNDGGFLRLLAERGVGKTLGIEASGVLARHANENGVETLNEFFSEELARRIVEERGRPEFVSVRYLLEHVKDLDDFVAGLSILAGEETVVLIEVPELDYILEKGLFPCFWNQHVNYFNAYTLSMLFETHGLEVKEIETSLVRADRAIFAWIKKGSNSRRAGKKTSLDLLEGFASRARVEMDGLRELILKKAEKQCMVAYGASHFPANVINYSGIGDFIEYAVDADERKRGKYLPGSALEVRSPEFFEKDAPGYCLIAAVGSEKPIMRHHVDYAKEGGRFITVCPPEVVS